MNCQTIETPMIIDAISYNWKRLIWSPILILFTLSTFGQCTNIQGDTLFYEGFEKGIPIGWTAPHTTDGGNWEVDTTLIGYYANPGKGNWVYVNDDQSNSIGEAVLTSPKLNLKDHKNLLELEVIVSFQEYDGKGKMTIEAWNGYTWGILFEESQDFSGKLTLDVSTFTNEEFQLRFLYDDEGERGWGMGLDDFTLIEIIPACGNGMCELGETALICPDDCGITPESDRIWVPIGEDLNGNAVAYKSLQPGMFCDDCSEKINLSFEFDFYEKTYNELFLNSNGTVSFDNPFSTYTPEPFCLNGPMIIAPFFADIDLNSGGTIEWYVDPEGHYFVATWNEVGYYGCGPNCGRSNTFQLILMDSTVRHIQGNLLPRKTTVVFNYQEMDWTTAESCGGINGYFGKAATVGMNLGDGNDCKSYGLFDRPGPHYLGENADETCPASGIDHLDFQSIFVNGTKVEVIDYDGKIILKGISRKEGNFLAWETDYLVDTEYFVIERSADSLLFDEMEIQFVKVDEEPKFTFDFIDENPPLESNFYRITQIRNTGEVFYSEIIELHQTEVVQDQLSVLSIAPNPVESFGKVTFFTPSAGSIDYLLADTRGNVHKKGSINANEGENSFRLSIPELSTGIYVLSLFQNDQKAFQYMEKQ